jgi:hypothetical protein
MLKQTKFYLNSSGQAFIRLLKCSRLMRSGSDCHSFGEPERKDLFPYHVPRVSIPCATCIINGSVRELEMSERVDRAKIIKYLRPDCDMIPQRTSILF